MYSNVKITPSQEAIQLFYFIAENSLTFSKVNMHVHTVPCHVCGCICFVCFCIFFLLGLYGQKCVYLDITRSYFFFFLTLNQNIPFN